MYLFFDTETTGVPTDYNLPYFDTDNWPRMVQLAYCLADEDGTVLESKSFIIKPDGYTIPDRVANIHGITTAKARKEGVDLFEVLQQFETLSQDSTLVVAHNYNFDFNVVGAEYHRNAMENPLIHIDWFCTMKDAEVIDFVAAEPFRYGRYKWPTLMELYQKCFGRNFDSAHNATADMVALKDCFFELQSRGVIDLGFDE